MKYYNFAPGPSKVSVEVKRDIQKALNEDIPSLSHRSEKFYNIFRQTRARLKEFLGIPQSYSLYFVSSATECMEILARNCTQKKSYHFVSGAFSRRFLSISQKVGNVTIAKELPVGQGFNYKKEIIPAKDAVELIAITHTETPTGVSLKEKELKIFRKNHPQSLMAIDIVSVAGTKKIDFRLADAWFFSVQKGFGLPAGLGVLIVSDKVRKKACQLKETRPDIGGFHSIFDLEEAGAKDRTIETPNVLNIYLLWKQTERFLKKGLDQIEKETEEKARFLYAWAEKKGYELCAQEKKYQASSVLCLKFPAGIKVDEFHKKLEKKNIFIGKGYKEMKETHFRIANFPSHTLGEMKMVTKEIDKILGRSK